MKTLAERIQEAQDALLEMKNKLVEQEKSLDSEEEGVADAAIIAISELSENITKATGNLDVLKTAENALGTKAIVVKTPAAVGAPAIISANSLGEADKPEDLLVKSAVCTMEAYIKRVPVERIMDIRYPNDDKVKAVLGMTTKAAQDPAMTSVAGWAEELTRTSYAAFMDLLMPEAVVPNLPLNRFDFNGFASVTIPMRVGAGTKPDLAAAFRAEGDPIRVGAATLSSSKLTPKSMGVIGTFTQELFERSSPNIENSIRKWMIEDTSIALDGVFLGAGAVSATTPAGIQTYATSTNTAASTGVSAANITADIRARLQAMAGKNMGRRPVWIMNPARAWGVSLSLTAAGSKSFPEMANGVLLGVPVHTSVNVPADVVFLVDAAEIAFAGGAPKFMGTDVATIHEEALQSDVAPIVAAGSGAAGALDPAADIANPVRSLFQTNSAALRCVWSLDWTSSRPDGSVQTITAANW